MLQPGQFAPNQAWILFKLNQVPISTETDGEFDVIALMDAASLFMLGSEFVPAGTLDSAVAELKNLMECLGHSCHRCRRSRVENIHKAGAARLQRPLWRLSREPMAKPDGTRPQHAAIKATKVIANV